MKKAIQNRKGKVAETIRLREGEAAMTVGHEGKISLYMPAVKGRDEEVDDHVWLIAGIALLIGSGDVRLVRLIDKKFKEKEKELSGMKEKEVPRRKARKV